MVGMPYLLLGAFGLLIYREIKKKAGMDQQAAGDAAAGGGEDPSCSGQSPDESS